MSEDGVSMNTFMNNMRFEDYTLILFEDSNGWKFGGLCLEEWRPSKSFYGSGENFVFTFRGGDSCEIFRSSGNNQMF